MGAEVHSVALLLLKDCSYKANSNLEDNLISGSLPGWLNLTKLVSM